MIKDSITACTIFTSLFVLIAISVSPASSQNSTLSTSRKSGGHPAQYCTNRGDRVELGKLSCLHGSNDRMFLARCVMVLNNPSWKKVGDDCPESLTQKTQLKQ
jgi:hypothetical protein